MQIISKRFFMHCLLSFLLTGYMVSAAAEEKPERKISINIQALTPTDIKVPANSNATVEYRISNKDLVMDLPYDRYNFAMKPVKGVVQNTSGSGLCGNSFVLHPMSACVLSLQIKGSELSAAIKSGPEICDQQDPQTCFRPASGDTLKISPTKDTTDAVISVTASPLTLTLLDPVGTLTINNNSTSVTANDVMSSFNNTSLNGKITETGNTCASIAPGGTCTLSFTPGSKTVSLTSFTIKGSNTNSLKAAIAIQTNSSLKSVSTNSGSALGENGVTLTGTGLNGTTAVSFDGEPATSVKVINSTTVTAVTPAHPAGTVSVQIDTSANSATLAKAYTYVASAPGQPTGGGIVVSLDGLITASTDNSTSMAWSSKMILTHARSNIDGVFNTANIVSLTEGDNNAAQLCNKYQVDSQGNTPCQAGNTCYSDWFLPANKQLSTVLDKYKETGFFEDSEYWSSTESTNDPAETAIAQRVIDRNIAFLTYKVDLKSVRCVRSFNP